MSEERRRHERIARPLEGSWRGASGATQCRVGDVSLGGCFIYSMSQPVIGEETEVLMRFGETLSMAVKGRVVAAEPAMGFSIRFNPLTAVELDRLGDLLERIRSAA